MSASALHKQLERLFPHGLRGLIFDCDGVLVNSRAANIGYYNLLLRELGRDPLTPEQEDYAQMATSRQAVEQVLSPEEMDRLPEISRKYPYSRVSLPLLKAEPGLVELVCWLHEKKMRLAVHTNRGDGVWPVLENIGLTGMFTPVMTVEDVLPKPSPEGVLRILADWNLPANQVGFVGDSLTDAGAAEQSGVPLIAYDNQGLRAALHVDSYIDFKDALKHYFASVQLITDFSENQ